MKGNEQRTEKLRQSDRGSSFRKLEPAWMPKQTGVAGQSENRREKTENRRERTEDRRERAENRRGRADNIQMPLDFNLLIVEVSLKLCFGAERF